MEIQKSPLVYSLVFASALVGIFTHVAAADRDQEVLDEVADQYNRNKSNDKYKVVCKKEAPIGSRIKQKICRTVAMSANSQREIKRTMDKLRTSVGKQP